MKNKMYLSLLIICLHVFAAPAQVVLNEISFGGFFGDFVELKNIGTTPVDVSGFWLVSSIDGGISTAVQLSSMNQVCATNLLMQPDDIIVFDDVSEFLPWQNNLGEVALYITDASEFLSPDELLDYVAWGSTAPNTFIMANAEIAGQWTDGDFIENPTNGFSQEYNGVGDASSSWFFNNMPTICMENVAAGIPCEVEAGVPSIAQFDFCVGDGISDSPLGLTLVGGVGEFAQWVVTDVGGVIIDLPTNIEDTDFENSGEGLCIIYNVVHDGTVEGLTQGGHILSLQGCHAVSMPVLVVKTAIAGGTLVGGPFEFCVGDGEADFVSDVFISNYLGTDAQWVVTDEQGFILALPEDIANVNFDVSPAGNCLIWHLAMTAGALVPEVGQHKDEVDGCFAYSNGIVVERLPATAAQCGGTSMEEYVLIGFEDLKLEKATVMSGGLGVTQDNGDLELSKEAQAIADGVFCKGPFLRIYDGAKANNICAIPAQPQIPDFLFNNTTTTNDQDVDVDNDEVVTLTESVYEDIDINDGATVTFSGQEFVYIEELDIEDNVTILFDQCTNLIIKKRLSIGKYNNFNPSEMNVFLFVEDDAEVKRGSFVYAGIYTLQKLRIRKAEQENPTVMHGIFIGEDVKARHYVELWYENILPCQPNLTNASPMAISQQNEEEQIQEELSMAVQVNTFPNPADAMVYLNLSEYTNEQVATIQVMDMTRQVLFQKQSDLSGGKYIAIDTRAFPMGMYMAHIRLANGTTLSHKFIVVH